MYTLEHHAHCWAIAGSFTDHFSRLRACTTEIVCANCQQPTLLVLIDHWPFGKFGPSIHSPLPAVDVEIQSCNVCRVPEECPQWVADIITRCMGENPESRPTSKEVFRLLRSDGAEGYRPGTYEPSLQSAAESCKSGIQVDGVRPATETGNAFGAFNPELDSAMQQQQEGMFPNSPEASTASLDNPMASRQFGRHGRLQNQPVRRGLMSRPMTPRTSLPLTPVSSGDAQPVSLTRPIKSLQIQSRS